VQRREFITFLGSAVAGWPTLVRAQQSKSFRRIGILVPFKKDDEEWQRVLAAFKQRLVDLGWVDGRNVVFDYKFTGGNAGRIRAAAAELAKTEPDVVFASSNVSVAALQAVTRAIPIVFVQVSNPVESGFVVSTSRPGGNVTGFQSFETAIGGKWLEVLREIAPDVHRIAVIFNPNVAANVAFLHAVEATSISSGLTVIAAGARDSVEIERVLTTFASEPNGGVIVTPSPVTVPRDKRDLIIALVARLRLPAVYPYPLFAKSGGLISYEYDQMEQWRGAASQLDRILHGAKPAAIPVQLPTKYQMVINLKTAKALGLTIPPTLLALADEVIE
jgi:ABC-type uncharacterized transport system substrate-binding protein